ERRARQVQTLEQAPGELPQAMPRRKIGWWRHAPSRSKKDAQCSSAVPSGGTVRPCRRDISLALAAGFLVGVGPLLVGVLHRAGMRELGCALLHERVARDVFLAAAVGLAFEHERVAVPAWARLGAVAAQAVDAAL